MKQNSYQGCYILFRIIFSTVFWIFFFRLSFSRTKSPNMFYKIVVPGSLQETPADLNMGVRHVSVRSATIFCRIAHPCDVYVAWQSSGPFIPGLLCSERLPNYSKESLTKTPGSNAGGPGGKIVSCKWQSPRFLLNTNLLLSGNWIGRCRGIKFFITGQNECNFLNLWWIEDMVWGGTWSSP